MLLHAQLLADSVQLAPDSQLLFLQSAADPFVANAANVLKTGSIILAEDNIASLQAAERSLQSKRVRHVPFHAYCSREPAAQIDVAVMNMLYQPNKAWMEYGLNVATYALKPGGRLYVVGAKDRGMLSLAKRMQEIFGNSETLIMRKGHRVVCARLEHAPELPQSNTNTFPVLTDLLFAEGQLDEGTSLLLDALEVQARDIALDLGCGAGYIGLHIARRATAGHVTMVDASFVAVDYTRQRVAESGLKNVTVLPSDGAQAVIEQRFDLVATNPPFHQGGIQTTAIAERFIREAAQVLRPAGRFYLVANRFLKYEPALRACFKDIDEVAGTTRFKVLRAVL